MLRLPRQRVVMRKRELAIKLQQIAPHIQPSVTLEQYTIPADLAAEILFQSCYVHDDIESKFVVDLGTGTGRLALGAAMLGAEYVVGVDIDADSLKVASRYAKLLGLGADWALADIKSLRGPVDTVLMNPPFGTKQAHADTYFLQNAVNLGRVVYSIHKSSTRPFLTRWLQPRAAKFEVIMNTKMEIPHQFPFHHKEKHYVEVDVLRIHQT